MYWTLILQIKTHVTTLLADRAIRYIANQRSLAPDKPFFLYFATGATHAPHQVDQKWRGMYKGKFDKGYDWYREQVLKNQKKLGVVPADAQLPPRDPKVQPWDSLSPQTKKVYAKYMEVYAAFMTHADHEIGRVVHYLEKIGQLDNTVIIAMIGDNGSSPSSRHGSFQGYISDLPADKQVAEAAKHLDQFGTEESDMDAPFGWTQATNTPFRLWKVDANSEGGTHNPLIIYYPKLIKEKGGIRNQYGHVNDIAPTTVELTGSTFPEFVKGIKQKPFEGTSLVYSLNDANAPSRHTVQYYEIKGKRAIYKDGWKASVYHLPGTDFSKDVWELYNISEDFNERFDLAAKNPGKLKELQDLFDAEAKKYNVYPLNDGAISGGRFRSAFGNSDKIVLYPGVDELLCYSGPQFSKQSFSITAEVNLKGKEQGVLFATGDQFDGLSLYIKDGRFQSAHNSGSKVVYLETVKALPSGKVNLRFELNYVAPKVKGPLENAGTEAIYVNDEKIAERKITAADIRYIAPYHDAIDVGKDLNSPVTNRYSSPFAFTGELNKVVIEYK